METGSDHKKSGNRLDDEFAPGRQVLDVVGQAEEVHDSRSESEGR